MDVINALWLAFAFCAGWAARSLIDAILTKLAVRVLTSAAGKDKMAFALAKLAKLAQEPSA